MPSEQLLERFWRRVDRQPDGCWLWTGHLNPNGYAQIRLGGVSAGRIYVHRFAYELLVGPIPEGMEIDHLCSNRACVNPEHLEPVSRVENIRRSRNFAGKQRRQTHCVHGHEFTATNTYKWRGHRFCRACQKSRRARRTQLAKGR